MIKALAVFVTLVAALITAVAGWDRGGNVVDKSLLVAMWIAIVLAVHLLPAIIRNYDLPTFARWLVLPLWLGCFLAAIFGQMTFLNHANLRANVALAQQSVLTVGTERQFELTREALSKITARPVALVAAELAKESDKRVRAALTVEIAQGKKAETLRDDLVRLSGASTSAQVSGATDPDIAKLSHVFGWSEESISLSIGLFIASLFELFGMTLWMLALSPSVRPSVKTSAVVTHETSAVTQPVTDSVTRPSKRVTNDVTPAATRPVTPVITPAVTEAVTLVTESATKTVTLSVTNDVTNDVTESETDPVTAQIADQSLSQDDQVSVLKDAIKLGECKGTVSSIREFLGCSQTMAMKLRKELAI